MRAATMIYGIGTDLLRIDRVERVYRRFGDRFVRRVLMDSERREFAAAKSPARFLAMRFAAKEAIVKALGTGFRHGMWVRDSGVRHDRRGRPEIIFSPRGKAACAAAGVSGGYLSLTDEAGLVVATAILVTGSGSTDDECETGSGH